MTREEELAPKNLEAEQAILGAILLDSKMALPEAMDKLRGDEFYSVAHRNIYNAMVELGRDGDPIDLVTLVNLIDEKGWLAKVGGPAYLAKLADSVPTVAHIGNYLDIVIEKRMLLLAQKHADDFHDLSRNEKNVDDLIESSRARLDEIAERKVKKKQIRHIGSIALECFEDVEKRYNKRDGTGVTGVPSGFTDLDRMTSGFQPSDFIIVAARPSVGKSALMDNIAQNAADEIDDTIAIFSLEMSEKQLVQRSLSGVSMIDGTKLRTGHLIGDEWEKLSMAVGILDARNIWIDDTPAITPWEILSKCRRLKQERGLGMILIDYLQLMSGRRRAGSNRQEEVSEISRMLKLIAKELEVPVIALSQLSRNVEQRQDKRPMMSDLRESGSLEQDADIVIFLYRDDYYDRETEKKNIIEVIMAKQRNGPIGTVELLFMKNVSKFFNVNQSHPGTPPPTSHPPKPKADRVPDMYRSAV